MYYDQIKLLKQGVEKARGLLGDAIDVVPGLGTVNQGLLAAENIGRGNLAGAAENIQNLVPTGKIAGRAIKALTKGKGQSELSGLLSAKAPRQDALDLAQKRAALPVSDGGLGLPPDNTPMDRAKAMGYLDRVYHGTDKDFGSFDPAMSRQDVQYMPGIFTADSPDMSAAYGDRIMPLLQKRGTTVMDKREARRSGAEIPVVDTIYDKQKGIRVTNDPSNLRSVFAAFDPMRRNESDLLALQGGQYTPQDLLGFERMMGLLGE